MPMSSRIFIFSKLIKPCHSQDGKNALALTLTILTTTGELAATNYVINNWGVTKQ